MAKKKAAKKKTRSAIGKSSGKKGKAFEQKIARDLRLIYDGPEWVEHHKDLTPKQRAAHIKSSRVRRSDQAKGAREPDLVVSERSWWFELQHTNADHFNPEGKLLQAERDIAHREEVGKWHPISICLQTGCRTTWCAMRLKTLLLLATGKFQTFLEGAEAIVRVPYDDVKHMLEQDEQRPL